jgi:hypothetical protein
VKPFEIWMGNRSSQEAEIVISCYEDGPAVLLFMAFIDILPHKLWQIINWRHDAQLGRMS